MLYRQWQAAKLVGRIGACLCSIWDVGLDLEGQLTFLSKLSHSLAYLEVGTGGNVSKFLPTQPYHDLQASVKNAFITVAKVRWLASPLFIQLLLVHFLHGVPLLNAMSLFAACRCSLAL